VRSASISRRTSTAAEEGGTFYVAPWATETMGSDSSAFHSAVGSQASSRRGSAAGWRSMSGGFASASQGVSRSTSNALAATGGAHELDGQPDDSRQQHPEQEPQQAPEQQPEQVLEQEPQQELQQAPEQQVPELVPQQAPEQEPQQQPQHAEDLGEGFPLEPEIGDSDPGDRRRLLCTACDCIAAAAQSPGGSCSSRPSHARRVTCRRQHALHGGRQRGPVAGQRRSSQQPRPGCPAALRHGSHAGDASARAGGSVVGLPRAA